MAVFDAVQLPRLSFRLIVFAAALMSVTFPVPTVNTRSLLLFANVVLLMDPLEICSVSYPAVQSVILSLPPPLAYTNVSFPEPPVSVSVPAWPLSRSSPAPPERVSFPAPPYNLSVPASPYRLSAPLPPVSVSFPSPPQKITPQLLVAFMISLPASPQTLMPVPALLPIVIVSFPALPWITWLLPRLTVMASAPTPPLTLLLFPFVILMVSFPPAPFTVTWSCFTVKMSATDVPVNVLLFFVLDLVAMRHSSEYYKKIYNKLTVNLCYSIPY